VKIKNQYFHSEAILDKDKVFKQANPKKLGGKCSELLRVQILLRSLYAIKIFHSKTILTKHQLKKSKLSRRSHSKPALFKS